MWGIPVCVYVYTWAVHGITEFQNSYKITINYEKSSIPTHTHTPGPVPLQPIYLSYKS